MSFPPGTEMFQFPGFALPCGSTLAGGFPHSEILGSKLVRSSPRLIAAYHVLHRLSAPRHPSNTLIALDHSHYRCPPVLSNLCHRRIIRKTSYILEFRSTTRRLSTTKPTAELPPRRSNEPSLHDVQKPARPTRRCLSRNFFLRTSSVIDRDTPTLANGGARRDRTDDLMLAKHALSQLSYGPITGQHARNWWARKDLNFRPHAYQARALTS